MRAGSERKASRYTLRDLLEPKVEMFSEDPLLVLSRWRIYKNDPETLSVRKRVNRIWHRFSLRQQWLLLRTAEQVAEAEKAKTAWNPKARRDRYETLADNVIAGAKLAESLANWFPPPWDDEHAAVGVLITQIVSFVEGALDATVAVDKYVSASVARKMLQRLKLSVTRKGEVMPWQLIRSLAWLASGKRALCEENSERTVRRYFEEPILPSRSPASKSWSRNWDLIRKVSSLGPGIQRDEFEKILQNFLKRKR